MEPFFQSEGLPLRLKRWMPTVEAMLFGFETNQPIYIMIDQKEVKAGETHRRPRPHVDGYWLPDKQCHGGGGGGHSTPHCPTHAIPDTRWRNPQPTRPRFPIKKPKPKHEAIILASDVAACAAYEGEFEGVFGEGGDCSHIDFSHLSRRLLAPNTSYAGNVTMIHESIPVERDCRRTLVRLNCPGLEIS